MVMSLKQELSKRSALMRLYDRLQAELAKVRALLAALPRTGHYRPQVQLVLCEKCGEPFSARDIRTHIPRCKGK